LFGGDFVGNVDRFIAGKEHLEQYAESLKELVLLRLIKQLSQVYTTIKVSRLNKLVPFLTPVQIEKVLVDAVTGRTLVFRLNHRDQSLVFSSTLLVASDDTDGGARLSAPQTGVLRGQLTTLSKRLRTAINMIDPARRTRLLEARQRSSEDLVGSIEQEHDQIVKRKRQIEKLKEEQENARIKMAKDMHARAAKVLWQKFPCAVWRAFDALLSPDV
jgi:translation initiation factor 3 subunit A